nr:exonuclease domain-containing protein [Corynebacterium lactis]
MTSTTPPSAQNSSAQNSRESAITFDLTGTTVRLVADGLRVTRKIETSSAPGVTSAPLADVLAAIRAGEKPSLTPPTRFTPGFVALPCSLPSARFMPSRQKAAEALLAVLTTAAENSALADGAAGALGHVLDWIHTDAPGVEGISVTGTGANGTPRTGRAAATAAVERELARGGVVKQGEFTGDIEDFAAFDVETANGDAGSIIQLGVAIVRGGAVAERYSWLCRPPKGLDYFDEANIAIHGITAADVAGEPPFAQQVEKFVAAVEGLPIVAHNARFDFTALTRACRADGISVPKLEFACTYMWARQLQLGLPNLKLPTLAQAAGSSLDNHHDATADAVACAEVALWLMRRQGVGSVRALSAALSLSMGSVGSGRMRNVRYDPAAGLSSSGDSEAAAVAASAVSSGSGGSTSSASGASATAQTGKPRTFARKNPKWDAAKTPDTIPDPNPDADPNGLLFGQRVTLTGDFAPYDKGFLWEKIADAGANINKGVTKKTTILVAGPWDSVTSKEKRARQLRDEGQEIDIWSEKDLFSALGLSPEGDAGTAAAGSPTSSEASASGFGSTALPGDDGQPPF